MKPVVTHPDSTTIIFISFSKNNIQLLIKVPTKLHKILNNSIIQGQEYKKGFSDE